MALFDLNYYPFFPKDFITSKAFLILTNEQLGGYWKLLNFYWIEENTLPNDTNILAKLSGLDGYNLEQVLKQFKLNEKTNTWHQTKLDEIRNQIIITRQKKAEGGKKGMMNRYHKSPAKEIPLNPSESKQN